MIPHISGAHANRIVYTSYSSNINRRSTQVPFPHASLTLDFRRREQSLPELQNRLRDCTNRLTQARSSAVRFNLRHEIRDLNREIDNLTLPAPAAPAAPAPVPSSISLYMPSGRTMLIVAGLVGSLAGVYLLLRYLRSSSKPANQVVDVASKVAKTLNDVVSTGTVSANKVIQTVSNTISTISHAASTPIQTLTNAVSTATKATSAAVQTVNRWASAFSAKIKLGGDWKTVKGDLKGVILHVYNKMLNDKYKLEWPAKSGSYFHCEHGLSVYFNQGHDLDWMLRHNKIPRDIYEYLKRNP